jgi:Skp family chaperone for outer membrane proteins
MPRRILSLASSVFLAGLTACQGGGDAQSPIAVVDLDAVAQSIGRDDVIEQQLATANQQLVSEVNQLAAKLQTELDAHKARLETERGEDAETQLAELALRANQQLEETKLLAQARSAQVQTALIQQFQTEVKPTVADVARRHGARLAVSTASGLVWFEPNLDITGQVIAELRSKAQSAPVDAPAAPRAPEAPAPAPAAPAAPATPPAAEASPAPAE